MNKIWKTLRTLATRRLVFTFDKIEFTIDGMPRKRLFNWLAAELTSVFKTQKALAYPTHLQIEPTTNCNLECPLCNVLTDAGSSLKTSPKYFPSFLKIFFFLYFGIQVI